MLFRSICAGVSDALLAAGKDRTGDVSNYFGVVETNGRGMLHLHSMIWLSGNLEFFSLRDRLQSDPVFADKMIRYVSSIIKCTVDAFTGDGDGQRTRNRRRFRKPASRRRQHRCFPAADAQ